jgi:dolichol-phosphate mannosyltransferase
VTLWLLGALQIILAVRVGARLLRTSRGERIAAADTASTERISVILPVLNEVSRLGCCLESLILQPEELVEILVVDGGSMDGTQSVVGHYSRRDARVKLVDASPVDNHWTGKAWGLHVGLQHADSTSEWILFVDADVRTSPQLVRSLLRHAQRTGNLTFSVATLQRLSGALDGIVHPALLATLIYRFGIPGSTNCDPHRVQANGQCFMSRRETLIKTDAIHTARYSLCEDITMARRLAECGEPVGFYENDRLIEVTMFADGRDAWKNWSRSLPARDQYFGWRDIIGLAEVLLVQGLPLPGFLGSTLGWPDWFVTLNGALLCLRFGVLAGSARAYVSRPWSFWLSPCCDLPVALKLIESTITPRHSWRGRTYVRRRGGRFEAVNNSSQVSELK